MSIAVICLLSFLIGGIPFGYLLGRLLLKDDIRNHGSGNIGATNVARVIGWKWGSVVLVLDALKGFIPTWAAMRYAQQELPQSMLLHTSVAAGVMAILGHMYPVYLLLRGGKGVATAVGVIAVLAPKALLGAFIVFAIIVGTTKLVGLGSIVAATAFGGIQLYLMRDNLFRSDRVSMTAFAVAIPLLIIWRHRSNIARLLSGTEPPVTESAAPENTEDESSE